MHFYSKKSGRRKNWNIYYVGILSSIFLCAFGIKQGLSEAKLKEAYGFLFILPHRQIKYPVDFDDELKTRKRQIR